MASPRFEDLTEFETCDWGNRFLKQMKTGDRTSVSIMSNSVVVLDESKWGRLKERYKYAPERYSNTIAFGFRKRDGSKGMTYVAVGDHAGNFGRPKAMTEEIKYDYDRYWGAIVGSQLIQAFPQGNKYIVLAVAHPTKSIGQRQKMLDNTLGYHYIELLDGTKLTFLVREILPWDEPVGGIVRWAETDNLKYNALDLRKNQQLLVIDIGGGVTSMTRIIVDYDKQGKMILLPVYDLELSPSISMGARTIMEKLANLLRTEHPAFEGMKTITDDMLEQGIRSGFIDVSGTPTDVMELRGQAEYEFIDQVENIYSDKMEGGRLFKALVDTGGGMHSYHERLTAEIWNHPYVESAGELWNIHLANLYGGDEMFRQWIQRERTFAGMKQ